LKAAEMRRLLEQLGTTPAEVASSLTRLGHKGFPGKGCHCPVANYLRANGAVDPEVDSCSIYDWGQPELVEDDGYTGFTPPAPVATFIDSFDNGAFPDLVLEVQP
jgi:hypothetical protein